MQHQETPELQFAHLFQLLLSNAGLIALVALIVASVIVFAFRNSKWWLLALLLFFTPLMPGVSELLQGHAIAPFYQMQIYGRPICGALLILMLIPTFCARGWRIKLISASMLAYLFFQLVFSMRFTFGDVPIRGIVGGIIFLLIFAVFGIGLPRWLQDMMSVRALLRSIACGGLLLVGGTIVQLIFNRNAIIALDRLYGLTNNPQQMGLVLAMTLPVVAFLTAWKGEVKSLRIVWAISAALIVLLLLWTGSRTGALVALISLTILFRRHVGRLLLFSGICAALVLIGVQMWFDVGDPASRIMSAADSRTHVWLHMIGDFVANPAIGVPEREAVGSENSFLLVAARVGLVGLVPFAIALGSILIDMLRLYRVRDFLAEQSLLLDLVIGGMTGIFAGAFFEGYLMGLITHQIFMIFIYLALVGFLRDAARLGAMQADENATLSQSDVIEDRLAPFQEAWIGR